ncbi:hypothetical protein C4M76_29510, partial [Escherichia coli]|uniref:hypothetical protein n=1 Tax=Escherichia coli TaxID=562 RepID=UPI000D4D4ACF
SDAMHDAVRVLSGERYYGYQYGGAHKCYLDLQYKDLRACLAIVSLPIGGKSGHDLVECATNVTLFDEL